jgi:hypothetical protein
VTSRLKSGIMERRKKNINGAVNAFSAAANKLTTEEQWKRSFLNGPCRGFIARTDVESKPTPCGGGLKYLHRSHRES